ncbi:MAG: class IV adenylate cyclase [Anaerolineales bacterium]|nr:class IV adenylate cyclase [Anaerolineales bacterium]
MSDQSTSLEVEVKFLVANLAEMRRKLLLAGAVLKKARVYERNIRFDTPDEVLLQKWQLLRLRQDTAVRITFKSPVIEDLTSEAKVREELEITVDDFDTAVTIFKRLGFHPIQVYEKYRETFQLGDVEVVLDEMPFGNFMELEGSEFEIKKTVTALNLEWNKRILGNYLGLMSELKAFHNLPFNDLTFANFQDTAVTIADILPAQ